MDLNIYWKIIKRRWLFMVIPAAVVIAVTVLTAERAVVAQPLYNVGVRFLVAPPEIDTAVDTAVIDDEENRYYQWLTSEYIVNGVADWANGIDFAERVSAKMSEQGADIPPLVVFNSISAEAIRSRLTVTVNHGNRDEIELMIDAVISVLQEQNAEGVPHLQAGEPAEIVQLDVPIINEIQPPITGQLDLPIRIVLGLIVGVIAGVAAEYFDPYIRSRDELETAGLRILGDIPREMNAPNTGGDA